MGNLYPWVKNKSTNISVKSFTEGTYNNDISNVYLYKKWPLIQISKNHINLKVAEEPYFSFQVSASKNDSELFLDSLTIKYI